MSNIYYDLSGTSPCSIQRLKITLKFKTCGIILPIAPKCISRTYVSEELLQNLLIQAITVKYTVISKRTNPYERNERSEGSKLVTLKTVRLYRFHNFFRKRLSE
ncbi:hypothetical protein EG68_04336 [Paragonimus skrjabini miyazakii]|uniref:Uncharacterized protein n=1 Tax=Paragonimus skrjabini miyazakii TaxID=59628 RepID=A0A8S9Z173_9TREM|nr:hypothetical protein EG68_04336 [Paragonimus skrjabini miyazakii]